MKLTTLIAHLNEIAPTVDKDCDVHLMIEVMKPERCQYEYPANDISVCRSKRGHYVVIMHEKFNGEDLPK